MKSKLTISFLCFHIISTFTMEQSEIYTIPAVANRVLRHITREELFAIKPEHLLSDEGVIEGLIIRPEKNQRRKVTSCQILRNYIVGDKNQSQEEDQEFGAVTLMRADVSHALGGMHFPGDNIHVRGLRMGKNYLNTGDLITIIDTRNIVKVILLKTYIPHSACWKLLSRCGQEAFDFLNSEGAYELGVNTSQGLLDGVQQRLRGIRLAVLKEGTIAIGDKVLIERAQAKEKRLHENNLIQVAVEWISASKELGLKMEKEDEEKMKARKSVRLKKF